MTNTVAKKKETSEDQMEHKVPSESFYGTGKRKSAISKVWLFKGKGRITINKKEIKDAVPEQTLLTVLRKPLELLKVEDKYDVRISTTGGGKVGQAHASSLGISRALIAMNPEFRKLLKEHGLLTRDARVKERKKYGRKKARKGFQFRKR